MKLPSQARRRELDHPSSLALQPLSPALQGQHSIPSLHSLSPWTAYSHLEESGNGSWNVGWKKKKGKKKKILRLVQTYSCLYWSL